ncbi:hypothetical protein WS84_11780 [Burkholderia anthina]|nr:hypothetical protein WS85_19200 [Burkholderia anthina]OXI14688.1 hypothetical protein CFB35_31125 [Burkholderia sp. AU16482]KVH11806.1 hypothetical protein WS84_11780 [Burkholderia anthina]KVM82857.1 hypothetical protein WT06_31315 [Burkholderia anthina]KVN57104.1 hypothetical protein WT13_00030 [Burkholderia anthina]
MADAQITHNARLRALRLPFTLFGSIKKMTAFVDDDAAHARELRSTCACHVGVDSRCFTEASEV